MSCARAVVFRSVTSRTIETTWLLNSSLFASLESCLDLMVDPNLFAYSRFSNSFSAAQFLQISMISFPGYPAGFHTIQPKYDLLTHVRLFRQK